MAPTASPISLLAAPGHALSALSEAAGLTGPPSAEALARESAKAAVRAELRKARGKIGGYEAEKGGTYDTVLDWTSRAVIPEVVGLVGKTGGGAAPGGATDPLYARTGTSPAMYEAEIKAAREKDEARQKARDVEADAKFAETATRVGMLGAALVAREATGDERYTQAVGSAVAHLAGRQARGIGKWASEFNIGRAALDAVGAAGDATVSALTGGVPLSKVIDAAVEKSHFNPGELTQTEAFLSGLPAVGRYLFGQDGDGLPVADHGRRGIRLSTTALKASEVAGPRKGRPLTKKVGVAATPRASPSRALAATRPA